MTSHGKKVIAPIIIVLCIVGYYVLLGFFLLKLPIPGFFKILAVIGPGLISMVFVKVLIERIQEIRKGEEDDLSEY